MNAFSPVGRMNVTRDFTSNILIHKFLKSLMGEKVAI